MTVNSLNSLFDDAEEGLSSNTTGILVNNLNHMNAIGATGALIDDLAGDEVTLFVVTLDKSQSMETTLDDATPAQVVEAAKAIGRTITEADVIKDDRDNYGKLRNEIATETVIFAFNEMLDALEQSKAADSILMSVILFNDSVDVRHGYLPLSDVPRLDSSSYVPEGTTALYDATTDAFTGVVAYGQTLRNAGIRTKVVVVDISDGENNASRRSTEASVAVVAKDLLKQEIYQLAFVFFGRNGEHIAKKMGFNNLLTADADPSSIRKALGTVSKSVIRASQTQIGGNQSGSFFS